MVDGPVLAGARKVSGGTPREKAVTPALLRVSRFVVALVAHSLLRRIAWRFAGALAALFLVSLLIFSMIELLPGDFAAASGGRFATEAMLDETRQALGLYRSPVERYADWLDRAFHGDFGQSWTYGLPVWPIVAERLGHSLFLAALAALVTIPVAVCLGLVAAAKHGSVLDRALSIGALTAVSLPEFLIAYILLILLAVKLSLVPVITPFLPDMPLLERIHGMALPILTLFFIGLAPIMRLTRASIMSIMSQPYIDMAHLKGIGTWRIVFVHALPNAAGSIASFVVIVLANSIMGLLIVETIFNFPGVGQLMINAVSFRDIPLVQACGLMFAALYISLNLIADIIAMVSNPRLRYPMDQSTGGRIKPAFRKLARAISLGRRPAIAWLVVAAVLAGFLAIGLRDREAGDDPASAKAEAWSVPDVRDQLTAQVMLDPESAHPGLVNHAYFMPIGGEAPAHHDFSGTLRVPSFEARQRIAAGNGFGPSMPIPGFTTGFFVSGDRLVPLERGVIRSRGEGPLSIILSPGHVWSEADDDGWSRASFPFTLFHDSWAGSLNGVAAFLYNETEVSDLWIQIAQEAVPGSKFDVAGRTAMAYAPSVISDRDAMAQAFEAESAWRLPVRPWSDLYADFDEDLLDGFDGVLNRQNVTVSGLVIDGVVYLRPCRTRYGPYPYCDEMRHSVYSITKTLGATLAMLRLAQIYGEGVFDERILDYIEIPAEHDGWRDVTFGDALNMATGVGDATPTKVDRYVESDFTALSMAVGRAPSVQEKLRLMAAFPDYPWGPGEALRYRSVDTFTLAAAMDAFLKSREGEQAELWSMMEEEVFQPLGIPFIPVNRTRETRGATGVPLLGFGLLPTWQEALKLSLLMQNGGIHEGQQILHPGRLRDVLDMTEHKGLPSGWRYKEGGEANYYMGLWRTPHRAEGGCGISIPAMNGFGGNYILLLPKDVIAFRFADGSESNPGTYDSYEMRRLADHIRPFCD